MKKYIIILAAFFAAALLVPGCNPEYTPGLGSQELKISLFCDEPETKADPEPDPFAFEKVIDHFDFFFFKDAAGAQPIRGMHGRVTGSEKVLDTSENGEYNALRKGTSYVYILANYPGSIDHATDHTLAELLALPVDDPIVTAKEKKLNPITGDMEETGNVTYCSSLVMDSYQKATSTTDETYTTKLTPQAIEEEREVTIKLSRLAAKLALIINVEPSVPGSMTYTEGGTTRQEEWTPVLKDLHAYFVNALNNKSTVKGNPVERDTIQVAPESYEYLTYPTLYPLTADASDDHKFTSAPAYTYPQEWADTANGEPYFKIQIPWESSLRGSSNFYYKVALPKSESNKRTLNRNMFYQVMVDLSVIDTENEYVEVPSTYVVTPWLPSFGIGKYDPGAAEFFNVPVRSFELYNQEVLSIPYYSSSSVSVFFKQIKFQYFGTNEGATFTYNYTNETTTSIDKLPNTDSDGKSVPAPARDPHSYSVSLSGKTVRFEHALPNIFTVREITLCIKKSATEYADIIIRQHPAIEIKKHPTMNMFINGWFGHVKDPKASDGTPMARYNQYTDHYGNIVYRSSKGKSEAGTHWSDNYHEYPSNFFGTRGLYGALATNNNGFISEPYLTEVVVSAFSETNKSYKIRYGGDGGSYENDITNPSAPQTRDYVLGDPRVKASSIGLTAGWLGSGYLKKESYSGSTLNEEIGGWDRPQEIMIAAPDVNHRTFVAPRFLLASTLNVTNGTSYEGARRRAAVYQEEGYPAGRWRLPTEAEICFIIDRQNDGSLPPLLRADQYYWTADGNVIYVGHEGLVPGSATPSNLTSSGRLAPLRFVYDLWYWGDADPNLDKGVYHPNMHLVEPNN